MPTIQSTRLRQTAQSVRRSPLWVWIARLCRTMAPGLHIGLLPEGAPGDPIRSPAVRIRFARAGEYAS